MAFSSSGAEVCAMNKRCSRSMRLRSLAADVGVTLDSVLRTDASAAMGVVNWRDVGNTQELWLQR